MSLPPPGHDPVLLDEVLAALDPKPGKVIVDCTLGRGGHAAALLERLGPSGLLVGLDADPRNLEYAAERLRPLGLPTRLFHANFSRLGEVLRTAGIERVDGVLADLGISTNQLFDPQYGLSFDRPAALDMRLDPTLPRSAADLVNRLSEEDLANVLYEMAQERYSRRIARKIVEARRLTPIQTTEQLADLVRSAIPRGKPERIDPATRTFMALRIAVNRELQSLETLLAAAPGALKPGGRLAVISFHSMEDRLVKHAFRTLDQIGRATVLTKKPVEPTEDEQARNPRSRSAKLRVMEMRKA